MEKWKLPSQLVTTDRQDGDTDMLMLHRHEMKRRLQAEHDLILCLEFIESLCNNGNAKESPKAFIHKYLNKEMHN